MLSCAHRSCSPLCGLQAEVPRRLSERLFSGRCLFVYPCLFVSLSTCFLIPIPIPIPIPTPIPKPQPFVQPMRVSVRLSKSVRYHDACRCVSPVGPGDVGTLRTSSDGLLWTRARASFYIAVREGRDGVLDMWLGFSRSLLLRSLSVFCHSVPCISLAHIVHPCRASVAISNAHNMARHPIMRRCQTVPWAQSSHTVHHHVLPRVCT